MHFAYSTRVEELRTRLQAFMDDSVYPAETVYQREMDESGNPHHHPPVIEELKVEARSRGLWNLFLPDSELGAGLS
ncbi:MAG: acyl-CoA dehydrogenase, partial [Acidimicrobiia bacterium]